MNGQGFTLIELIAAMVLVGVAAVVAGTSFMSFARIGESKNYSINLQLAQQRMELILAEKVSRFIDNPDSGGFPGLTDCAGVDDSKCGPDPCNSSGLDDICNNQTSMSVSVIFKGVRSDNTEINGCKAGVPFEFEYCKVKITTADDIEYYMNLYKPEAL